jgi:4-amino-4-deoxy-L-arabinose transferase-like glycosyltransferase
MIIGATYHFHRAWTEKKFLQLLLAAFMTALAIMTKGIFVVITIGAAVLVHLVMSKKSREIFHWRWLAAGVLILLFISPELYALYVQFDLHPEKTVFGTTNVSGLKFFFWDSQFGRFFNTGPIKGKGDPSFFLHTTLWAFLPWSILLYVTFFQRLRHFRNAPEWYCLGGSLITVLLFSLSRFQLPHYINILFPFFAIITAAQINEMKNTKALRIIQYILVTIMIMATIALHLYFQPGVRNPALLLVMLLLLLALIFLPRLFKVSGKEIIIGRTVLAAVVFNLYLNGFFYPKLLTYQGGTSAAQYVNKNYPNIPLAQLKDRWNNPLEFYLDAPLLTINTLADTASLPRPCILLLHEDDDILGMIPLKSFGDFRIAKLNTRFLDPKTREQQLKTLNLYARF